MSEINEKWVVAFNRWMDDYTANPDGYSTTQRDVMEYLRERLGGEEPSYGQRCAALFAEYLAQS